MANTIQAAASQLSAKKGAPKLADYVKSMEKEIAKALPSVITPERFTRITLSALSSNPDLQQCTPQSFLGAMMSAAQLGVDERLAHSAQIVNGLGGFHVYLVQPVQLFSLEI